MDHLRDTGSILTTISSTGLLDTETEAELEMAVDDFLATFVQSLSADAGTATSLAGESNTEETQERIVKRKRG